MPEAPEPEGAPRRAAREYEDPHFHDEDEVAPAPPADSPESRKPSLNRPTSPSRKLPPRPRRFHED